MRRSSQQGISLIELMIAMVIGLMLMAGMLRMYQGTKRSYQMQDTLSQRQESARFAAHMLMGDAQMAGFRGCLRDNGIALNALTDAGDFLYDFARHAEGYDAQSSAWAPALPIAVPAPLTGTDVLVLRTVTDPQVSLAEAMPGSSSVLNTNGELNPVPPLADGDIVFVSDCGGTSIFQITGYDVDTGEIDHATGSALEPGNATEDLGRLYAAGAQIFRLSTTSYYIAPSAAGTGPALWRRVGTTAAEELAAGIENMQVQYGEDTDADQVADNWENAGTVGDWDNVVALRVALLVAGVRNRVTEPDPRQFTLLDQVVGPFNDGRLRRVLNFTVALRNHLP